MKTIPTTHNTIPAKLKRVFMFSPKRTMGIEVHALYQNSKGFILEHYMLVSGKLEKYGSYLSDNINDIMYDVNYSKSN